MIRTLVKLAALLASYLGWWEFFREKYRLNVYFVPAFTLAFQFSAMFLPGLLNFLPETVWLLYLGGLALLLDVLRRKKLGFLKNYLNFGYVLAFLALAVMALAFRGKILTWFDNFTHWGTAVKNMLQAGRFPTFAQSAVTFHTYPLGSTALIYYFSRFTSDAEDFWMLAQGFQLLCLLLPMFAWGKRNSILTAVILALAGNYLLCYNTPLTELLVDTLLPLAGTALLLFIHRECLEREDGLSVWLAVPFLFWVMNIKNAGILYTAAGLGILLWSHRKKGSSLKPLLVAVLILAAGYLLWDRHCDYVFYQEAFSQHEISMDYFLAKLGEKTLADAWKITCLLARAMVVRRELLALAGVLAVLILMTWTMAPQRKRQLLTVTAFSVGACVVYGISLAAMYIFSMALEPALELQSADRYIRVGEMTVFYLLTVYAVDLTAQVRQERLAALVLSVSMGALSLGGFGTQRFFGEFPDYDPAKRLRYGAPISEYGVTPGHSYLICVNQEDNVVWYPAFLWSFRLDTNRVYQMQVTDESQMAMEKDYDYVVILDEDNPVIEAWVEKTYPEQQGRTVIQCFK